MAPKSHGCTCIPGFELRSKECIDNVLDSLIDHIDIPINGSLTSKDIFQTTISMAVDKNSIHSITKRYQKVPCETSIRHHLKKLNLNDLIESNEKYVIRGQAKKSTNSFYSYISLYIINGKERFTVSVLPIEKGKSKIAYLGYFLDLIKTLDVKIEILCLDREFYSIDVFEFLRSQNIPHIVPVVKKGMQLKKILNGKKSRLDTYVMKNSKKKILLDIVIDVKYMKGKRGKKRI